MKKRWILVILWMIIIFTFSAQPAEESGEISLTVGRYVGSLVVPGFQKMSDTRQQKFAEHIEYGVRKTAHATEYAILLILAAWGLEPMIHEKKKRMALAFAVSVLYAGTDEFHQLFVMGRSGQVKDVLIDSGGAAVGLVLYCIWGRAKGSVKLPENLRRIMTAIRF